MKYNIKLNIKSIVKAEQFLNKPFSEIDLTDEKELTSVLYCIVMANNDELFTYDEFIHICQNENQSKILVREFEKYNKVIAQFQRGESSEKGDSFFIKNIVTDLIVNGGVDADFVMNMPITDLSMFIEAYDRKKKESLENSRLWTFLQVLPHVKGVKNARDIYIFPWEIECAQKEAEASIAHDKEMLERFLKEGKNIINNGTKF